MSQFRSDGPASVMQAVPTQYRDYANDGLTSGKLHVQTLAISGVFWLRPKHAIDVGMVSDGVGLCSMHGHCI